MSKATISEAMIQASILQYLAARHIFAMRMNSGTQIVNDNGHKRAIHMHEPGTADILAFPQVEVEGYCGVMHDEIKPFWIEVKSATGKQTPVQKSFQRQVEDEGHKYIIARSIEDVEAALR